MKLFKSEIFQGSLNNKNYFEGWYFKHVSSDQNHVYAFIPGISLSKYDAHAFIQIINGLTGDTHYIAYPTTHFKWKKNELYLQIGDSIFTKNYIDLNINDTHIKVKGRLDYSGLTNYPKTLLSPGIMGWYSYIPFMECYHGMVSANHVIYGVLEINATAINFNNGKGYIEKDWGTSFPECWIWLQSNSFNKNEASLFVSIAKIPWFGKYFMGFIAFLYLDGKFYRFATYNNSKLGEVHKNGALLVINLENHKYKLAIQIKSNNSGELIAPVRGSMHRRIKESIDSTIKVALTNKKGHLIFEDESKTAGLEIIDRIFDYL